MADPYDDDAPSPYAAAPLAVGNPSAASTYLGQHAKKAADLSSQYDSVMTDRQASVDNAKRILDETTAALRARHSGTAPGSINLPLLALSAGLLKPTRTHSFGEELSNGLSGMGAAIGQQRMNDDEYDKTAADLAMKGAAAEQAPLKDKAALLKAQQLQEEQAQRSIEAAQIRGTTGQALKPIPDGQGGFLIPDGKGGFGHLDPSTNVLTPVQLPGTSGVAGAGAQGAPLSPEAKSKLIGTLPPDMQPSDPNDKRDFSKLAQLYATDPKHARALFRYSEGLISPDETVSMRQNRRERIFNDIQEFDPTYTPTLGKERNKAMLDFLPAGKTGQALISNNTLIEHAGQLLDYARDLKNNGSPVTNIVPNMWADKVQGNQAVTNFKRQQLLVATELSKLLKGGEPAEGEIKKQLETFNENSSPDQIQGAVEGILQAANARKSQLMDEVHGTLGHYTKYLPEHRNAEAEKTLKSITENPLVGSRQWQALQAAKRAQPQAQGDAAVVAPGALPTRQPGAAMKPWEMYRQ